MGNEAELTGIIVRALNNIPGVLCWRMNTGRRGGIQFGKQGQGDITGLLRGGRRLELEVKLPTPLKPPSKRKATKVVEPKTKQSPKQVEFEEQIIALGGVYSVVESVEDAIKTVLWALGEAR